MNDDGSVRITGEATSTATSVSTPSNVNASGLVELPAGKYSLSGRIEIDGAAVAYVAIYGFYLDGTKVSDTTLQTNVESRVFFEATDAFKAAIVVRAVAGVPFEDAVIYPMLSIVPNHEGWVEYREEIVETGGQLTAFGGTECFWASDYSQISVSGVTSAAKIVRSGVVNPYTYGF